MINHLRFLRWKYLGRRKLKKEIERNQIDEPLKIIIGSGGTNYQGWISTDLPHFDITSEKDWICFFNNNRINNILAEHVLEHLTIDGIKKFLTLAKIYLTQGGKIRIAIPDKYNPDPIYQNGVCVNGNDIGAYDHKVFLSIDDFSELAKKLNFKITPLEYYNKEGLFINIDYTFNDGFIFRSNKNNFKYNPIPKYSSLIIDLEKCVE